MFRFEALHEIWLNSCTEYIKHLFGDSLKGKTVIDYAFGRGNWSVAFLRAGAEKVIAIDASIDNVNRFQEYCKKNNLNSISVIQGNLLNEKFDIKADFIWLYGILHHLNELNLFLTKIKALLKNQQSQLYVYYYNKKSLRETVVECCRNLHVYDNESEFLNDNYLFLKSSKNRASDDLVAPYINWFTALELKKILNENGIYVKRQDIDFYEYQNKTANEEFYPHQFLCGLEKTDEIDVKEKSDFYETEINILSNLAKEVLIFFTKKEDRKKISIGIFNTHFTSLKNNSIKNSLIEIFLYLMRLAAQVKEFNTSAHFNTLSENYYNMLMKSVYDIERNTDMEILGKNLFTEYLQNNRIRL